MLDLLLITGHSLEEYQLLFLMARGDLNKKILDIGGGCSSFNAELTKIGGTVISLDVLYDQDKSAIDEAVTKYDRTPKEHGRISVMDELARADASNIISRTKTGVAKLFVDDYSSEKSEERYRWGLLPAINYERHSFDLALCSHLLFYQSKDYAPHFHIEAIDNMAYVAKEVRIAPLVQEDGEVSPHIDEVVKGLEDSGHKVDFIKNRYPFYEDKRTMVVAKI